ncbi:MAG TPA: Crp/Fnr family transcriptional regulator [Segetibacter sp.]
MFEVLFKTINEKVLLTDEEQEVCKTFFTPKKLRKKQYLLQQDDISRYTAFVEKGALKSYTVDEKGNEHILQFALEGWWASDMYSFITSEPASYNIDALEDCELLLLSQQSSEAMMQKLPKMERYFRLLGQNAIVAMQRRMIGSLSQSAEEKYSKLVSTYPNIVQRVPQHMIASYLGITPETVSRIRKNLTNKSH